MQDNDIYLNEKFEEMHIWDFPDDMYIELPINYRTIFFQLVFLEFKTTKNLQKILKENNLNMNIFRWRDGKDCNLKQLIHLKSLLFLVPYAVKRRCKLINSYNNLKKIDLSQKRVIKTKTLISLFKEIRYIYKGNRILSKIVNINQGTLRHYLNNNKIKRIPSNLILKLFKIIEGEIICFSFSLEELENKIISYKTYHGKEIYPTYLGKRKLPLNITPEFESILYHLFGDGYVSKIGSGEYTQLNNISKNNFLKKLYNSFGYFKIARDGFNKGRVYINRTIINIIKGYYKFNVEDFLWYKSKLPNIISTRDKYFKLAGIVAFIVDEAYIGKSNITIHSSNKILLSQIRELLLEINIQCSNIALKKGMDRTRESYRFNVLKEGVRKLFIEVNILKSKYPTCNFSQKEDKIIKILNK